MPTTPLKDLYNFYRYIQHLILKSKFDYDDIGFDNPLDEDNLLLQTRGKFMKYVIYYSFAGTELRNTSNQNWLIIEKVYIGKRLHTLH